MWRWHTRYLHALDPARLAPLLKPIFPQMSDEQLVGFAALVEGNLSRVEDVLAYARISDHSAAIADEDMAVVMQAGGSFFSTALELWQGMEAGSWKLWTGAVKENTGCKGRELFLPLRVALTGAQHGPEMSHVIDFLGREGVALRLEDVIRRLEA